MAICFYITFRLSKWPPFFYFFFLKKKTRLNIDRNDAFRFRKSGGIGYFVRLTGRTMLYSVYICIRSSQSNNP